MSWSEEFVEINTERLLKLVVASGESFIRGWCVIFINEYNQEQDRVLILTDKAYYRVKFLFRDQVVKRFQRIDLEDIVYIERGKLTGTGKNQYGFRIHAREWNPATNTYYNTLTHRTFRLEEKVFVDEVANAIFKTIQALKPSKIELKERDIPLQPSSLFSKFHNKFDFGRQKKKVGDGSRIGSMISDDSRIGSMIEENIVSQNRHSFSPLTTPSHSRSGSVEIEKQSKSVEESFFQIASSADLKSSNNTHRSSENELLLSNDTNFSEFQEEISGNSGSWDLLSKSNSLENDIHQEEKQHGDEEKEKDPSNMFMPQDEASDHAAGVSNDQLVTSGSLKDPLTLSLSDLSNHEKEAIDQDSRIVDEPSFSLSQSQEEHPKILTREKSFHIEISKSPKHEESVETEKEKELITGVKLPPQEEIEEATSQTHLFASLFDQKDKFNVFAMLIILCFFLGYFHFSLIWIIGIFMYMIVKDEQRHHVMLTKDRFKSFVQEEKRFVFKSRVKEVKREESSHWFSNMFGDMWPHMVPNLRNTVKDNLAYLLDFGEDFPPGVKKIDVVDVQMGMDAPIISHVHGIKTENPDYRMDFDIKYNGELRILLDLIMGKNDIFIKIPLVLDEIQVEGRMRFDMTFFAKSPYLNNLSYCFMEMPDFSFSFKALNAFDLTNIPFMKDYLENTTRELIYSTLVWPEQVHLPYHSLFGLAEPQVENEKSSLTQPITFNDDTQQHDLERHNMELTQSVKQGEYAGVLHARIIEAKKLKLEKGDPYCIVSSPHEVFTTKACKKNRKNPIWNEFFEFIVKKDSTKTLDISVMCRQMNRDAFVGMATIEFSDSDQKAKGLWVTLEGKEKNNPKAGSSGEIYIQLRYVGDPLLKKKN